VLKNRKLHYPEKVPLILFIYFR